ncbi:uncharacterized protein LOC125031396 [Penaeus chinensis]|uniref:uncharacterized protein LOC125031396 n=1 Tax=Penaeus chinensis TaxID=139456 RepID=UPI001FB62543|nr:uncharacterized protein LOC125031396 [Penaeus chinensis]
MAVKGVMFILFALCSCGHGVEVEAEGGSGGRYLSDSQLFTLGTVNISNLILFGLGALLALALLAVFSNTPRAARYVQPAYARESAAYERSQDVHRNLEEAQEKYQ